MYTKEQEQILIEVIDTFGQPHQFFKLIEEMSELSRAISKLSQQDEVPTIYDLSNLKENIISEMIDVDIVLWQLKHGISENKELSSFYQAEKLRKFEKIKKMMEEYP